MIRSYYTKKGKTERMYLNHAVILTYQKTFIQPEAVRSISKKKLSSTGYNVHAALSGTRESVFYNCASALVQVFMSDGYPYFLAFKISSGIFELKSEFSVFE